MSKIVLVVENQEDNRRIMCDLLASGGFSVFEATRRIKGDPEIGHIPIIAVTSSALSGDKSKALAAGCDVYVTKPFSPREQLALVRELPA